MKKSMLITGICMLFAAAANSQHISFVASWGGYQPWNVPVYVSDVVFDRYYDYDWVHTTRVVRHGSLSFNVILQHRNHFVELRMNRFGHVQRVRHFDHYPLHNHVCSSSCGYHEYYYNSFSTVCHSGHHHGHNHIAVRPRPVNYVWGYHYNYPYYVKGHGKKHYKHHDYPNKNHHAQGKGSKYYDDYNRRPEPIVVKQQHQRRQGTYEELERDKRYRRVEENGSDGRRAPTTRRVR